MSQLRPACAFIAICEAARHVVADAEQVHLFDRDSLRVTAFLDTPTTPNARLLAAASELPPKGGARVEVIGLCKRRLRECGATARRMPSR